MSRFYEALKEASRSRSSDHALPENGNGHAFTSNGDDVPAFDDDEKDRSPIPGSAAERVRAVNGAVPAQKQAGVSSRLSAPLALTETIPGGERAAHDGSFGTRTQLMCDHRARLIPFASDSIVVEYYRRLRTKILQQHATRPIRSLIVASADAQEGKTVTALNLGFSFAMLPNYRVLVVDGDLRRGTIGKLLGADDRLGFSDLIEGTATLEDVVLKDDGMGPHFMVRGQSRLAPAELLHSSGLTSHFERMAAHFDLVIVDSPPVNLIVDTQSLASGCDAVLLVARAFKTTRKSLQRAVQDLSQYRVIGTVLNGGTRSQLYRKYNGYY